MIRDTIAQYRKVENKVRTEITNFFNSINTKTNLSFIMYDGIITIKEINGAERLIVDENSYDYYYEDFNTKELINLFEAFMLKVNEELKTRGDKLHKVIKKVMEMEIKEDVGLKKNKNKSKIK